MSQFFCSTWQPSLLFAGRDRVKVICWAVHQVSRWWLMNSTGVVGVDAQQRERQRGLDLQQRAEHVPGRLVRHCADLGPGACQVFCVSDLR